MYDFDAARDSMIEGQVRTNDVSDRALIAAMRDTAREAFAPKSKRAIVYGDVEVPIADGRWLLRPRDFAKLVQALQIKPDDLVLDIACGRGYSTAVFARMAESVVGVDDQPALVERANQSLNEAGLMNAVVIEADLRVGAPEHGPFSVVFVDGSVEVVPDAWFSQLKDGGRLGVIVRRGGVGRGCVYTRSGGAVGERVVFDSAAPVLPGFAAPERFVF